MKLAIIGASTGQLPLVLKAKEAGHEVLCFAWEKGAICKDYADKFFPISIFEKEKISEVCKREQVDGVVSTGSDPTAEIASFVATDLGLHGINYNNFHRIKDKSEVRELTHGIPQLSEVRSELYHEGMEIIFPCIVKPTTGSSKKGVAFAKDKEELGKALAYTTADPSSVVLIEQFVEGREISVESISFEGKHHVIQITDKENDGAPHFVELSHHQPADIDESIREKIRQVVPQILNRVGIDNSATHVEMKIDNSGNLYLIEVNPRGGSDHIASLLEYSTGFDFLKGMIDVALGIFKAPNIVHKSYAGIYFLCKQRENRLKYFLEKQPWEIERGDFDPSAGLTYATDNYTRNGYIIYKSDKKIIIN